MARTTEEQDLLDALFEFNASVEAAKGTSANVNALEACASMTALCTQIIELHDQPSAGQS
jgi:hypothetical protein